jgi:outer membrane usher protein
MGRFGYLSLSALETHSSSVSRGFSVLYTMPLGNRTTASVNHVKNWGRAQHSDETTVELQRNLPAGEGMGYLLRASDQNNRQASVFLQSATGNYTFETAKRGGETATRFDVSGGVAFLGGHAMFSRRLTDSFAIVGVPNFPDVRIYAEHQEVAKTNTDGYALIPRLRPYENNRIDIEQLDLGLDTEVGTLHTNAVPYFRSGVAIEFPIRRIRSGTMRIVLPNGLPLPTNAVVRLNDVAEQIPVGFEGEVYLRDLVKENRLVVHTGGRLCQVEFSYPDTNDPIPDLGRFECK